MTRCDQVRDQIRQRFGANYLPEKPNFYKSKKDAQEAHEAIRPTDVTRTPEDVKPVSRRRSIQALPDDLAALRRFADAARDFRPDHDRYCRGTTTRSAPPAPCRNSTATSRVYQMPVAAADREEDEKDDDGEGRSLPQVREGEILRLESIRPDQHFTEPPPRYTEATLVKELEEKGIGRPSTYAAIISTIVEREYVTKDRGRFSPTMLGERVSVLLVKSFEDIFDVGFTARLEEELDEIEEGKLPGATRCRNSGTASSSISIKPTRKCSPTRPAFPPGRNAKSAARANCSSASRRHGFFLGCNRYPECDYIKDLSPELPAEGEGAKIEYLRQLRQGNGHQARAASACSSLATAIRIARPTGAWCRARASRASRTCRSMKNVRWTTRSCCAARAASAISSAAPNYPKCKYTRPITLGHQMPEMQRRRIRAPRHFARPRRGPHFLRLQPLPRLRLHLAARANQRAVPEMPCAVHRREAHQAGQFPHLHQRRLRLGN